MKKAFTLAEVLITLGVIGIIAAMTLPSLINYYKVKELEVRFKKADAIITQALLKTANEAGYDSISSFNIPGRIVTNENFAELKKQVEVLNEFWLKQFTSAELLKSPYWNKACYSMMGDLVGKFDAGCYGYGTKLYQLQDGLVVGELRAQNGGVNHPGQIVFFFDTNGIQNGPNRWGYDLFTFTSSEGYYKEWSCAPNSPDSNHDFYCYYYAHKNINPAGKNKSYWDMLFKPLSYWQGRKF